MTLKLSAISLDIINKIMHVLVIIIHLLACFSLILIVLLQSGKGQSMGAMFGGAGSQSLLGSTGASSFLTKATTAVAVIFMLTSLTLAYVSKSEHESIIPRQFPGVQEEQERPAEGQPVTPDDNTEQ